MRCQVCGAEPRSDKPIRLFKLDVGDVLCRGCWLWWINFYEGWR